MRVVGIFQEVCPALPRAGRGAALPPQADGHRATQLLRGLLGQVLLTRPGSPPGVRQPLPPSGPAGSGPPLRAGEAGPGPRCSDARTGGNPSGTWERKGGDVARNLTRRWLPRGSGQLLQVDIKEEPSATPGRGRREAAGSAEPPQSLDRSSLVVPLPACPWTGTRAVGALRGHGALAPPPPPLLLPLLLLLLLALLLPSRPSLRFRDNAARGAHI